MKNILQPHNLHNELIKLIPLNVCDMERLYKVASDPLIWEQHPENNRFEKEVFMKYFSGAIESKGAFLIFDAITDEVIGSSRYYEYDEINKTVAIGYTFLARDHWGTKFNKALKTLMLNHAFKFVNTVFFHIGIDNIRSQMAIERIGALRAGVAELNLNNRTKNSNFIYRIDKESWNQ